jgi:thymidine kinase
MKKQFKIDLKDRIKELIKRMTFCFYYGVMDSGKSNHLLQTNYNYLQRGMKTKLFLPSVIGKSKIMSRIGISAEAIIFDSSFVFEESSLKGISCIFIDEAQFLTKEQVFQLLKFTISVYCYGLRSDFRLEPFEGSMYLLLVADTLFEIKSVCDCGNKSTLNKRLSQGEEQVDIEGEYKSFCKLCFTKNNKNNVNDVNDVVVNALRANEGTRNEIFCPYD